MQHSPETLRLFAAAATEAGFEGLIISPTEQHRDFSSDEVHIIRLRRAPARKQKSPPGRQHSLPREQNSLPGGSPGHTPHADGAQIPPLPTHTDLPLGCGAGQGKRSSTAAPEQSSTPCADSAACVGDESKKKRLRGTVKRAPRRAGLKVDDLTCEERARARGGRPAVGSKPGAPARAGAVRSEKQKRRKRRSGVGSEAPQKMGPRPERNV
jgi:hypothetical protein